ncbi:DCL family protein [Bradyrhizobium sp. 26S5]|uniref:DCL family protein n=1 Tax=Bradyrhizobium sp. 26S5 TaxID=3139729 RepID=UPI0030CC8810
MTKKPVTIGPYHFDKKGDAATFLQAILHKYGVGDKVGAQDAEVLHAALALHPDAAAKVGAGITHFSVRSADFGTKCFWVNRVDGSSEKFSYKACIGD